MGKRSSTVQSQSSTFAHGHTAASDLLTGHIVDAFECIHPTGQSVAGGNSP